MLKHNHIFPCSETKGTNGEYDAIRSQPFLPYSKSLVLGVSKVSW